MKLSDDILQSQLHKFIALSLIIAHGDIVFGLAIADTDDFSGRINAALKLAFVSIFLWVRIFRIAPAVTCDAVRCVIAIRPVKLYEI